MKRIKKQLQRVTILLLILSFAFGFVPQTTKSVQAANTKYWIKVNKQRNVATVYQRINGKYKPIKAMLTSCGGSNTPSGTYYTPAKYRWKTLMGPSYGQYSTRIYGGILFHSVWYYSHSKSSQATKEFNKLGTTASHGCVRLSVADAKWIYDNCPLGTKVTVYSSSYAGPLGKPKGIKVSTARKMYWDPTDPDPKNPYAKNPVISISKKKAKSVEYGKSYNIKSGVTAKDGRTKASLTSKIKYSVTKYSNKKYRKAKFSTKSLGTYRITYSVTSANKKKSTKTFTVKVVDTGAPVFSGVKNYIYRTANGKNAVQSVTAKLRCGTNLTSKMLVAIQAPGASSYSKYMSYTAAKSYKFDKAGTYKIRYYAKSTRSPYKVNRAYATIYAYDDVDFDLDTSKISITQGADAQDVMKAIRDNTVVKDNGTTIDVSKVTITLSQDTFKEGDIVKVTFKYTGKTKSESTKTVELNPVVGEIN